LNNGRCGNERGLHARRDSLAGHRIHEGPGVADEQDAIGVVAADTAICLDHTAHRSADDTHPGTAGMPDPELLHERSEKPWHRNSVTVAGLTEDPHADIGAAAGHRKHPAVAGKQVVIEADCRLSPLDRDPLDVAAL